MYLICWFSDFFQNSFTIYENRIQTLSRHIPINEYMFPGNCLEESSLYTKHDADMSTAECS